MFSKPLAVLIDSLVAAGLFLALLVVILIDKRPGGDSGGPSENTLKVRILSDAALKQQKPARKLRLGVTPTQIDPQTKEPWDDMTKLLRDLGEGYREFQVVTPNELLSERNRINDFDVLFLTCAPRGQELSGILMAFVSNGGTLYASDWRYEAVAAAFPEAVGDALPAKGCNGDVIADIVDPGLRDALGQNKIHLKFDLPMWKTAAFTGPRVTPLIRGDYRKQRHDKDNIGDPANAPLLVKFTHGKGTVIFTSFHNEKQNSEIEKKLLQYLVFSLVTAGVEAEMATKIEEGGFEPQKSNLLSTPKDNPKVEKTYTSRKQGPLRFALGFRNEEGVKLRFTIKSPDGKTYSDVYESTVVIEVPDAPVGEWTYTVEALRLPYENFPFRVSVGEKR